MKYIYLMLISLFLFSSCEREAFVYDKSDNNGSLEESSLPDVEVSLASLKISLNKQVNSRMETDEMANYLIRIYNSGSTDTLSWLYKDLPELITLKARGYVVEALSHLPSDVAWNKPFYYDSKEFQVQENQVTTIGTLTCRLSSILVSVVLDEKLCEYIQKDARVVIRVGKGELTYNFGEEQVGSFMPLETTNTLTAELHAKTVAGDVLELSGISFLKFPTLLKSAFKHVNK